MQFSTFYYTRIVYQVRVNEYDLLYYIVEATIKTLFKYSLSLSLSLSSGQTSYIKTVNRISALPSWYLYLQRSNKNKLKIEQLA